MKTIELYRQLDINILELCEELSLKDLHTETLEGESFASNLINVTSKKTKRKELFDLKFYDNLCYISRDLKYCTAQLFILKPFVNNPLQEGGAYFKTPFDARYMMHANLAYQLTYNYFDQIGDLLDVFFETGLNGNIYFSRVINNFPATYKDTEEYRWYTELIKSDLKHIVLTRDEIVHNYHLETELFYTVMGTRIDQRQIVESTKTKLNYPLFFQKQLENCIEALIKAINLIDRLPDKEMATTNSSLV